MAVLNIQKTLTEDGLCKRCADIDWDEMAHAIEHYPVGRPTAGRRLHAFYIDTQIDDNEDGLRASGCRFCCLLAEAVRLHGLVTPGQLDCVHDGSSMASIEMDSMVPALAVTLDDVAKAYEKLSKEYANITSLDDESIKISVHACEQTHVDCQPDALDDLPGFRLIDCQTQTIVAAQDTVTPSGPGEDLGPSRPGYYYVTLSYVWGTKRDESRIGASGALENLPQTIDDSIQLCTILGYRYLWVDRYCIDQGNAKEKAIQIANMGRIYSSAQLTIISSAGEDPFYGLPGITDNAKDVPFQYETIKRLTVIVRPLSSIASISVSKWAMRGWTYQEGYLSRRRLFFTDKGTHYICNAKTDGAALHRFLPRSNQQRPPPRACTEVSDWTYRLAPVTRNLEAYSARQLTVDSDALDAITGALNDQLMHEKPIHHLWAVPIFETDIDYDLSSSKKFSRGKLEQRPRAYRSIEFLLHWNHPRPRRRKPQFPSWSFLGWVGRISYLPWPRQTHIGEHFDVHNLEMRGEYTFALTPAGTHFLDVSTYTMPLTLFNVVDKADASKSGYYVIAAVDKITEAYMEVNWSKDPETLQSTSVTLMGALFIDERKLFKEMSSTTVLVIEKIDNHFERVGICTIMSQQLNTMPASVRASSSNSMVVEKWQHLNVRMQHWQQKAQRQRILIG